MNIVFCLLLVGSLQVHLVLSCSNLHCYGCKSKVVVREYDENKIYRCFDNVEQLFSVVCNSGTCVSEVSIDFYISVSDTANSHIYSKGIDLRRVHRYCNISGDATTINHISMSSKIIEGYRVLQHSHLCYGEYCNSLKADDVINEIKNHYKDPSCMTCSGYFDKRDDCVNGKSNKAMKCMGICYEYIHIAIRSRRNTNGNRAYERGCIEYVEYTYRYKQSKYWKKHLTDWIQYYDLYDGKRSIVPIKINEYSLIGLCDIFNKDKCNYGNLNYETDNTRMEKLHKGKENWHVCYFCYSLRLNNQESKNCEKNVVPTNNIFDQMICWDNCYIITKIDHLFTTIAKGCRNPLVRIGGNHKDSMILENSIQLYQKSKSSMGCIIKHSDHLCIDICDGRKNKFCNNIHFKNVTDKLLQIHKRNYKKVKQVPSKFASKLFNLSDWMGDDYFKDKVICDLAIPGSHNSFAFYLDTTIDEMGADVKDAIKSNTLFKIAKTFIYNNAITQYLNFEEQLNIGIRYFDLRVTLLNDEMHYVHAVIGSKVMPSLNIFKDYLKNHPSEIIILDFQKTYMKQYEIKLRELNKINDLFGSNIALLTKENVQFTLDELRNKKINVLIIFRFQQSVATYPILNPYKKTSDVNELFEFVNKQINLVGNARRFFVSQLILSPHEVINLIKKTLMQYGGLSLKYLTKQAEEAINEYISTVDVKVRIVVRDFVNYANSQLIIKRNFY